MAVSGERVKLYTEKMGGGGGGGEGVHVRSFMEAHKGTKKSYLKGYLAAIKRLIL